MSTRQQKRRASGDPLSSRPAKRGRQTEPIGPHERALVQARRLAQVRSPVEIDEDVLARLSRQRPKGWTTSDEQTVNDEWNLSIVKTSSRTFANNQHSNLLNLWKSSLRIYMNPVKMISPLVSLRYQAMVSGKSAERDDDHVIYSPNFCSTLSSLMVHPCFEDIDKLIQALHYAIMCRLDDRTMWPCGQELGTDCPALQRLVSKLKACGDSGPQHPIHRMHASARAHVLQKGEKPSPWSDFLYHIGETVSKDDARRPATDAKYRREMGRQVLPLTLWDLKKIVKTIDTIRFRRRDDGITGTIDGLVVEDESLLASTRHTERPNVPYTVRGQSQFPFAEDVEDDGSASPGLSSVHDTLMYKCLRRDFDRLQARVISLEQSNMHLTCGTIANQKKIESLESEVDRLSDDNGKYLETIEILSEERLGVLEKFDSLQRQFDDLKRRIA
ncbi:hypothetical protein Forpe1208_v009799 [Fusarium oxysporum f. sp. rapae]|uniref:Uncharacterized protein n=1 Tax=Fusarium oxysporum f. sp. rapae TaxID=485398 RepID=A0A8J5P2M9_FUSOX|nr:hypothetical protein Forpe1208_v009799 [Fusarium oxysporum f. sp. rapae]